MASLEGQNTRLNTVKGVGAGCISDTAGATCASQEQTGVWTGRETGKHAAHRGPWPQPIIYYLPPQMMSYSYFCLNSHSCPKSASYLLMKTARI